MIEEIILEGVSMGTYSVGGLVGGASITQIKVTKSASDSTHYRFTDWRQLPDKAKFCVIEIPNYWFPPEFMIEPGIPEGLNVRLKLKGKKLENYLALQNLSWRQRSRGTDLGGERKELCIYVRFS